MRRAFTLFELMIVIAIMAALATLSVNGYRALTKGMKDRSSLVAVQTLIDAARQRAEIDRKPMLVFFYDELLTKENESKGTDLVGHGVAVAVRPIGRITAVDGSEFFCDEFGDLDQIYTSADLSDSDISAGARDGSAMRLYKMDDGRYVDVSPTVARRKFSAAYIMTDDDSDAGGEGEKQIVSCAFRRIGGGSFRVGDAYGGEFAAVVLPDGYYFGSSAPKTETRNRVGEPLRIDASGNGARDISIYAMKAGSTSLEKVGDAIGGGK